MSLYERFATATVFDVISDCLSYLIIPWFGVQCPTVVKEIVFWFPPQIRRAKIRYLLCSSFLAERILWGVLSRVAREKTLGYPFHGKNWKIAREARENNLWGCFRERKNVFLEKRTCFPQFPGGVFSKRFFSKI